MQRTGFPTPGMQSPTGTDVMAGAYFMTEAQWQQACNPQNSKDVFDYVVVGTGFCALAFVSKALELNPKRKILLLERGSFFLPAHFQTLPKAFAQTLGGVSETFPWTVDIRTQSGKDGEVTGCHGMVPFFGGRSTTWSTWCPRPTKNEMHGWPAVTIDRLHGNGGKLFEYAERLLRVQPVDQIDAEMAAALQGDPQLAAKVRRPLYGQLQSAVQGKLQGASNDLIRFGIDRVEAAHLASSDRSISGVDFLKFSVPGSLLSLKLSEKHKDNLFIKLNCTVQHIFNQQGVATALDTSCGVLPLHKDAKLILAMGALPPVTLVRNSFRGEVADSVGKTFSAHFISSITARVPRNRLMSPNDLDHQVGACYISGAEAGPTGQLDYKRQFHIQLSIVTDKAPEQHASALLRYMPDVVATASMQQLETSKDHVVLVCAVLGELDVDTDQNSFVVNPSDRDVTTNSMLRVFSRTQADVATWQAMDKATFQVLEKIGGSDLEYWHEGPNQPGWWKKEQPPASQTHVPILVHESSTMPLGDMSDGLTAVVDPDDYQLRGTKNVHVTGGALWPRGGSWNPTLTMVALAADLAERLVQLGGAQAAA